MPSPAGLVACFCLLFSTVAISHEEEVSTLVQAHAVTKTAANISAVKAKLSAVRHELEILSAQAPPPVAVELTDADHKKARAAVRSAAKFVKEKLARKAGEACAAACIISNVLDSMIILEYQMTAHHKEKRCEFLFVVLWWVTGLVTMMVDQKLDFPEATHMMMQILSTAGYGSSPPTTPEMKIFHNLHGIVAMLNGATGWSGVGFLNAIFNRSLAPAQAAGAMMIAELIVTMFNWADIAARTKVSNSDDATAKMGPTLADALYQTWVTVTTVGYGDLSYGTDVAKPLSVLLVPFGSGMFDRWVSTLTSHDEQAQVLPFCPALGLPRVPTWNQTKGFVTGLWPFPPR